MDDGIGMPNVPEQVNVSKNIIYQGLASRMFMIEFSCSLDHLMVSTLKASQVMAQP